MAKILGLAITAVTTTVMVVVVLAIAMRLPVVKDYLKKALAG